MSLSGLQKAVLGILNIQSKLWHFELGSRRVAPKSHWHCLPCLGQAVLRLMSEHNVITALQCQRPRVPGLSSLTGSLVGLASRSTAAWDLLIEGGYGGIGLGEACGCDFLAETVCSIHW